MGISGLTELKVDKSVANGLTFRPLSTTVTDSLAWYKCLPVERQQTALVGFDEKNKALDDSMGREQELLAMWHAKS